MTKVQEISRTLNTEEKSLPLLFQNTTRAFTQIYHLTFHSIPTLEHPSSLKPLKAHHIKPSLSLGMLKGFGTTFPTLFTHKGLNEHEDNIFSRRILETFPVQAYPLPSTQLSFPGTSGSDRSECAFQLRNSVISD